MSYIIPVHRPSSVRHALSIRFLKSDEDNLVVAKNNCIEVYEWTPDGYLDTRHSTMIFGRVSMLHKFRPTGAATDHLFVGTEQHHYFTISWDGEKEKFVTDKILTDIRDGAMAHDAQGGATCMIDPSEEMMVLDVYEGRLTAIPLRKQRRKQILVQMGDPKTVRIEELFIRSSAFAYGDTEKPQLVILFEEGEKLHMKTRTLEFAQKDEKLTRKGDLLAHEATESPYWGNDMDPTSSHLIPVKDPIGGMLLLSEEAICYYSSNPPSPPQPENPDDDGDDGDDDDDRAPPPKPTVELQLNHTFIKRTVWVAWVELDASRWYLADDYGHLYLATIEISKGAVAGIKIKSVGETSRASILVLCEHGEQKYIFVGSHSGDSQLLQIQDKGTTVQAIQPFENVAPVLDFTVMDLNRGSGEGLQNEYSSGQARIVTGSGFYQDGSLRSIRSGVSVQELGLLGDMTKITNLFNLRSSTSHASDDILVASFIDETRVFRFDEDGEVEEVQDNHGFQLSVPTIVAANAPNDQIVQVTADGAYLFDLESGTTISLWQPEGGQRVTGAAVNEEKVVLAIGGKTITVLDLSSDFGSDVVSKSFGDEKQISCVTVPRPTSTVCIVGFWNDSAVSILDIRTLDVIRTELVGDENQLSVPRSLLVTQLLPNKHPTLLVAMADGIVYSYAINSADFSLSTKRSMMLGQQEVKFGVIPRHDGLFNVLAISDHPSLIHCSEGRIVYSAVTAENCTAVCYFNAQAFPDSVLLASSEELKVCLVDVKRTTQVRTLKMKETVRRLAYSPGLKAFGLGCTTRSLEPVKGSTADEDQMVLRSKFLLVDEILFEKLDDWPLNYKEGGTEELVECVISAKLDAVDADGNKPKDPYTGAEVETNYFIVGTGYVDDQRDTAGNGRVIIFEVNEERKIKKLEEVSTMGACRCLKIMDGKLVAACAKTIVTYNITWDPFFRPKLQKTASYRAFTVPIDIAILPSTPPIIAVADIMKSVVLLSLSSPATPGGPETLTEVARHYTVIWSTAIAALGEDQVLLADAEGNLMVLYKDKAGATDEDRRRMKVGGEMNLGEVVNRIREIKAISAPSAVVMPRAFIGTVDGSIYLFCDISPTHQDILMTLQQNVASYLPTPGDIDFNTYRAFATETKKETDPNRFVDGEVIEMFLGMDEELQNKVCRGLGVEGGVDGVRTLVEGLRRLR